MSAGTESFIVGPSGPVHSGTGNLYAGPTFILGSLQQLVRVGRSPRALERGHLRWLEQRFVEPEHYGRARGLLEDTGSVLLTGAEGSGRRATAQVLLYRLDLTDAELIREVPEETDDPSENPVLDADAVESGQRLLLDLSAKDKTYCEVVLKQLPSYRAEVRERGAHLVVILPHRREDYFGSERGPLIVEIVRPKSKEVFQRYLRSDGITGFTSEQLGVDNLMTQLGSGPVREIVRLAELVRAAKERAPTRTFPDWLREARAALTERSSEVAQQVQGLHLGRQRALLLATAMFSEAHADAIFAAASTLCERVEHPEDDRPRLEWEGLAERFEEIKAKADNAGRVHFPPLAYDQAVLIHFWTNRPDLRDNFRDWVGTTLGHRMLSDADRDAAVIRFAEQALRTDRPDDLRLLAEHWVTRTDLLPQAATAVVCGLNHERYGRLFRHQLYIWSRDDGLSADLAQVVVQVCSGVLALRYPRQALVRLHHILRRHSGATAGDAARDALLDLTSHDRSLYRYLLSRVIDGPTTNPAVELALFLNLATSDCLLPKRTSPLITDPAIQGQLITGWGAALDGSFSLDCTDQVRTWLAACANERYREPLLTVLVQAAGGRGELLNRLYVIALDWAHAPVESQQKRRGIADCLNNKIDAELGLGDRTEGISP
ncbi:MAG: hypothetical protein JO272_15130 [Pseudonocardiales bacterium]|nr:hypothetical protein [Pseudonocardiales bacterium]